MSYTHTGLFPLSNDELCDFHEQVALTLEHNLHSIGDLISLFFGQTSAANAIVEMLSADRKRIVWPKHDANSFEEFVSSNFSTSDIEPIENTQIWRDAAEYGGQGIAPHGYQGLSMAEREQAVRDLLGQADKALQYGSLVMGKDFDFVWHAVKARAALDFQDASLSLENLCLLSGLSLQIVRNAVSTGVLSLNNDKSVDPEIALAWLKQRRGFIPSRWLDPEDDQYPQGHHDEDGPEKVFLPQTGAGELFLPTQVMRLTKDRCRISISVGKRGEEEQFDDFYAALHRLKEMPLARWRRVNPSGNWGLVSARGTWLSFDKGDLDRLIEERKEELGL